MLFSLLFFAILFLPALLVALLPSPYWRPVAAWVTLGGGLLLIGERNIPWYDQGMFGGVAQGLLMWVLIPLLIIAFVRTFRDIEAERPTLPLWADWHVPVAILVAVCFFHWLANRLAGAIPTLAVHLTTIVTAIAFCAGGLLAFRKWRGSRPVLGGTLALLALSAGTFLLFVGKAVLMAREQQGVAMEVAAGRPWCALTFAGNGKARPATHWLDLSPLVSRSGGRSYIEDVAWLAVEEGGAVTRYRRYLGSRGAFMRAVKSAEPFDRVTAGRCQPRPGGNLG